MTTERQRLAISFCEEWGFPVYTGDLNNFSEVSKYLSKYLDSAKSRYKSSIAYEELLRREFEERIIQENLGADYMG